MTGAPGGLRALPVTTAIAAALWLAAPVPRAAAQDVVIYRCVAADGSVMLQNGQRCPKGTREQRRVLEAPRAPAPPPAPAAPPAAAPAAPGTLSAPAPVAAAPAIVELAAAPAPPLHACRTWDGERYYGDSAEPAPRCAPLRTTALDGRSPTAAQACEMRLDTCEPVAKVKEHERRILDLSVRVAKMPRKD
ncbi:hypothetical protein EYQ95_24925, partial [Lysobacter sp. N42]